MRIMKRRRNELVLHNCGEMVYELNLSELELRQIKIALDELAMESCGDTSRTLDTLLREFGEFFEKEGLPQE